jgi:hypothetical protein
MNNSIPSLILEALRNKCPGEQIIIFDNDPSYTKIRNPHNPDHALCILMLSETELQIEYHDGISKGPAESLFIWNDNSNVQDLINKVSEWISLFMRGEIVIIKTKPRLFRKSKPIIFFRNIKLISQRMIKKTEIIRWEQ